MHNRICSMIVFSGINVDVLRCILPSGTLLSHTRSFFVYQMQALALLLLFLAGTHGAQAQSTGCTSHNIVQVRSVLVGFPLVNSTFNSTGDFDAGEVITFNLQHGPQIVNITSFTIFERNTSTNILNASGPATTTFTIPATGNYFFEVTVSATNPGPNPGVVNYTRSCVVGTPPPTVTGVTPNSGTTAGGTVVNVTGTNFTGAVDVTFGGTSASSFTVNSATSITATTPAGTAATVGVVVTNGGGSNAPAPLFTYVDPTPAPTVSAITPNTGTALGGTTVTITGSEFTGATAVSIGGVAVTSFTVNSDNSITAVTAPGTVGPASVLVTTPDGTNIANTLFNYSSGSAPSPTITPSDQQFNIVRMNMQTMNRTMPVSVGINRTTALLLNHTSNPNANGGETTPPPTLQEVLVQQEQERQESERRAKIIELTLEQEALDEEYERRLEKREELEKQLVEERKKANIFIGNSEIFETIRKIDNLDKELNENREQKAATDRRLRELENPVFSIRNQVGGVVVLAYAQDSDDENVANVSRALNGFVGKNNVQLTFNPLSNADTAASASRDDVDYWITGRLTLVDDSSAADRDGHLGMVSAGFAKRYNERIAVAAEAALRYGSLYVNSQQSRTDVLAAGISLSGAIELAPTLHAGISGYYEYGQFDSNIAGATGSYDAHTFQITVSLQGAYSLGEMFMQPNAFVNFTHSDVDSYTDSNGVFVPSQSSGYGSAGAGLTVSRVFDGDGFVLRWKPYVDGNLSYAFVQKENFQIGNNLIIQDQSFNGKIGAGIQLDLANNSTVTFSASFQSGFGTGLQSTTLAAGISSRF